MKLKAMFFDIGRTLVNDPFPIAVTPLVKFLVKHQTLRKDIEKDVLDALIASNESIDDYYYSHFWGELEIISDAVRNLGIVLNKKELEIALKTYRRAVTDAYKKHPELKAIDDVALSRTLHHLKNAGIKIGLISNEREDCIPLYLECLRLELSDFDVIVTSEAAGCGKPSKEIFLKALFSADVKAPEAAYVGDSIQKDVIPALALGMTAFWARAFSLDNQGPPNAIKLDSLGDLLPHIAA
jgi:HAD superfamily hydrolase (TIGR01549 family)